MRAHIPVLLKEVIEGLEIKPGGRYIDATLGGGGHATEITKHGGIVLGIDTDSSVVRGARENNINAVHGNFRDIEHIAKENGFSQVDGVLFDLGISSIQLDSPERGFSYRFSGPLDMRMNPEGSLTAKTVINNFNEEELYEIFSRFSEEISARPLARAIVSARRISPIETTDQLVSVVSKFKERGEKKEAVLSRIFQGLRIAVNDELGALKEGLEGAKHLLRRDGRLAVISFHSLEDRIVKQFLKERGWEVLTKKPIQATEEEIWENPRSRSAKLRIAQKQ